MPQFIERRILTVLPVEHDDVSPWSIVCKCTDLCPAKGSVGILQLFRINYLLIVAEILNFDGEQDILL